MQAENQECINLCYACADACRKMTA
ncbi:four-helix bundle copper-binding protein [Citrobacter tructae]